MAERGPLLIILVVSGLVGFVLNRRLPEVTS
jgi:hypothetical protein